MNLSFESSMQPYKASICFFISKSRLLLTASNRTWLLILTETEAVIAVRQEAMHCSSISVLH